MYGVGTSQNTSIHLSCLNQCSRILFLNVKQVIRWLMLSSSNIQTHIHDLHSDNCENLNPELLVIIMNYHDLF